MFQFDLAVHPPGKGGKMKRSSIPMACVAALALVAIFGLSAASASASAPHITAAAGTAQIDLLDGGDHTFTVGYQKVTCEQIAGSAEYDEPVTELTAGNAGLGKCETLVLGFITLPTTVALEEGCEFDLTVSAWVGEPEEANGSMHICKMVFKQYADEALTNQYCEVQVPAQDVDDLTYSNATLNEVGTVAVDVNSSVEATVKDFNKTGCNKEVTEAVPYTGSFWAAGGNKSEQQTRTVLADHGQFEADAEWAQVEGESNGNYTLLTGPKTLPIQCSEAELSSFVIGEPQEAITTEPAFAECWGESLGLKYPATVDTNGCEYAFDAGFLDMGSVSIVNCAQGIELSTTWSACEYKILPQTSPSVVDYDEIGSGDEREIEVDVDGVAFKYTYANGYCGEGGEATGTTYGTWSLRATNEDEEQVAFWIN